MQKFATFLSLFLFISPALFSQWKPLQFKPLQAKTVHLEVLRVINSRFPKMSPKQFKAYLSEAKKVVLEHFGVTVIFHIRQEESINRFFSTIPQAIKKELYADIYDFKKNTGEKKRLIVNIANVLAKYSQNVSLSHLIDYAKPYLSTPLRKRTLYALAEALIETEISRLKMWTEVHAKDGEPVINNTFFNEWAFWDAIGHFRSDFDIVLTNQLIASAEYYGQDMHSALRGGIVAGTTSYMKNSPFDSFVFVTSFLFLNNHLLIKKLRGDKNYTKEEVSKYAGAYLAHEIGHMLFRFSHPFNYEACVMNPAKLLYFSDWYQQIDAQKCPIGSNDSMIPGSVELYYNNAW